MQRASGPCALGFARRSARRLARCHQPQGPACPRCGNTIGAQARLPPPTPGLVSGEATLASHQQAEIPSPRRQRRTPAHQALARSPARPISGRRSRAGASFPAVSAPLQPRSLLAVTPRRSTAPSLGASPAATSGARVGQMTRSQTALYGCDDAHRSVRNARKTGVSAPSFPWQHCCGPGCRGFESPRSPH